MTKNWVDFYSKDRVVNIQNYIDNERSWDVSPCSGYEGSVDYTGMFFGIKFPSGFRFGTIDISNAEDTLSLFENCTFSGDCVNIKIKAIDEHRDMPERRSITLFKNCKFLCESVKITVFGCSNMRLFDSVELPTSYVEGNNEITLSYRASDMKFQNRDCRDLVKNTKFYGYWMFDLSEYSGNSSYGSAIQCENMFEGCVFDKGFTLKGNVGNRGSLINVSRMFNKCEFKSSATFSRGLFGGGRMLCMGEYPFLCECTYEGAPVGICTGMDTVENTVEVNEKVFEWLASEDKKAVAIQNMMDSGVSIDDINRKLQNVEPYGLSKANQVAVVKTIGELVQRILTIKKDGKARYSVGEAVDAIVRMGFSRVDVALGVVEFIKDDYFEE